MLWNGAFHAPYIWLTNPFPETNSYCMAKPTDMRIVDVQVDTEYIKYRAPIKFGGRVTTDATLLNVTLTAETAGGRRGQGFGSMPMGNIWAWPTAQVSDGADQGRDGGGGPADRPGGRRVPRQRPSVGDHPRSGRPLRGDGRGSGARPAAWPSRCRGWRSWWPPAPPRPPSTTPTARPWARTPTTCWGPSSSTAISATIWAAEFAGEYLDRYTLAAAEAADAALSPRRRAGPADRCGHRPAHRRRPAGNAARMDRRRRPDASEDQAQRRRPGLGRRAGGVDRAGGGRGPGRARLRRVVLFGRFQREVRQRRVRAGFPGPRRRAIAGGAASGSSTSSSRPTATCAPTRRTACTRRRGSSPW